jgi:hypothetical protein
VPYERNAMMVVTYEALNDSAFAKKYKECAVEGPVKRCNGFTVFPTKESEQLMGPNKLCQVYVRASLSGDELQSTIAHEHVHVLQYLLGAEALESVAYLMEEVLHQAVSK